MANILVVEDDPLVRNSLRIILESFGHAVEEAEDGSTALAIDPSGFDVVITDILMPGVSGVEVIGALRAKGFGAGIIAMSGGNRLGGVDPLEQALAAGADMAMRKPFAARDLMAALEKCTTRT
ncbi:MAG: response regulator [Magnetospirillum sp.]|nr:response regulator [Magnetospirillum sp.]